MSDEWQRPILIFTANYEQARECARRLQIKNWKHIGRPEHMHGTGNHVGIITDTFSAHPDNYNISALMDINGIQTIYINMDRYMI